MRSEPTVFVVDDEQAVRGSLQWLLESLRLRVEPYMSARDFLAAYDPARPGCLVLDVRMPDISGPQLQDILTARRVQLPIIFITGHGDIAMAVRAMKAGAIDFIEKPFNDQVLLERIQNGLALDAQRRREEAERRAILVRLASLTPREREVLEHMLDGQPNKIIADALGISTKTVEVHRAKVMEKMRADSVARLTAMCIVAGIHQEKP